MSMIQSAQVFSPRPSAHPHENLRVLQSPIKPFKTPSKITPSKEDSDEGDSDQEIVLVDGNFPRVLEEEKDLVILEDVEVNEEVGQDEQQRTPTRQMYASGSPRTPQFRELVPPMRLQTPQMQSPPQTPRRRLPGASLHRAVLIRSAQRAVLKAEMEKEEAEEEKEVEEFIVAEGAMYDSTSSSQSSGDESEDQDKQEQDEDRQEEEDLVMSTWRKNFEAVKISPFDEPVQKWDDHEKEESDITEVSNLFRLFRRQS